MLYQKTTGHFQLIKEDNMQPEKEVEKKDDVVLEIHNGFINVAQIFARAKEKDHGEMGK